MKKIIGIATLAIGLMLAAPARPAFAQEAASKAPAAETAKPEAEHEEKEPSMIWLWVNFLILAGALGYLIGKNAPAFFRARSQKIVQDMADAEKARQDAEANAADVDRRLANLETEIAALRSASQAEIASETERTKQHTAEEIAKLRAQSEQEIGAAAKAARTELKRYTAQLAIELAERKIRARMTAETQNNLVNGFVRDLETPPSGARGQ